MLKEELGDLVPAGFQFDIGFYKGNKQVWLRTESDVKEVVCLLKRNRIVLSGTHESCDEPPRVSFFSAKG